MDKVGSCRESGYQRKDPEATGSSRLIGRSSPVVVLMSETVLVGYGFAASRRRKATGLLTIGRGGTSGR